MKWHLSELWSIPYNSFYWHQINDVQWRVYAEHVRLDRKQESERFRDFAEYIMAFYNYDAVRKVQEQRENESDMNKNEDIFLEQLRRMGIDLDKDKLHRARNAHMDDQARSRPTQKQQSSKNQVVEEDTARVVKPEGK